MEILKERILSEGKILEGNILQVSSFLNHLVDTRLLHQTGKALAAVFADCRPTKIITIETSGVPFAAFCALELQIPFIIAKKLKSLNLSDDVYTSEVFSFTTQVMYNMRVSKDCINQNDKILIIDDFLASGKGVKGLMSIIRQANATLVGVGICIEKTFLQGAAELIRQGVNLHSLVRIASIENNTITFLP